jgi:hypothetical protein
MPPNSHGAPRGRPFVPLARGAATTWGHRKPVVGGSGGGGDAPQSYSTTRLHLALVAFKALLAAANEV